MGKGFNLYGEFRYDKGRRPSLNVSPRWLSCDCLTFVDLLVFPLRRTTPIWDPIRLKCCKYNLNHEGLSVTSTRVCALAVFCNATSVTSRTCFRCKRPECHFWLLIFKSGGRNILRLALENRGRVGQDGYDCHLT